MYYDIHRTYSYKDMSCNAAVKLKPGLSVSTTFG